MTNLDREIFGLALVAPFAIAWLVSAVELVISKKGKGNK
jgi:hypothetical protein